MKVDFFSPFLLAQVTLKGFIFFGSHYVIFSSIPLLTMSNEH